MDWVTLLTVNNLAMSGQLNIEPPNWWGDLSKGLRCWCLGRNGRGDRGHAEMSLW